MTDVITDLLSQPDPSRDVKWESALLGSLPETYLNVLLPDPQPGPDGFSYLLADVDSSAGGTPFGVLAAWLASKAIGLVINPRKTPYPDYVLTYGQLWHFAQTGILTPSFAAESTVADPRERGHYDLVHQQELLIGKPSETAVPAQVQKFIKQFLFDQSVLTPRWAMLSKNAGKTFDLVFSIESLNSPPQNEHKGILEALSWFLPPHYSLGLISETHVQQFYPI